MPVMTPATTQPNPHSTTHSAYLDGEEKELLLHTIAFRVTSTEFLELFLFFETFESNSLALRWLVTHPEVQETMRQRSQQRHVSPKRPPLNG